MRNTYSIAPEGHIIVDIGTNKHPGKQMLIDPPDWELVQASFGKIGLVENLNHNGWRVRRYARGLLLDRDLPFKRRVMNVHTLLLGSGCDHINNDGLDNRRANLRSASASENCCNKDKQLKPCTSCFKGVHYVGNGKRIRRWKAQVKHHGRVYLVGHFHYELSAALNYDDYVRVRFGKYARLNFPRPDEQGIGLEVTK